MKIQNWKKFNEGLSVDFRGCVDDEGCEQYEFDLIVNTEDGEREKSVNVPIDFEYEGLETFVRDYIKTFVKENISRDYKSIIYNVFLKPGQKDLPFNGEGQIL